MPYGTATDLKAIVITHGRFRVRSVILGANSPTLGGQAVFSVGGLEVLGVTVPGSGGRTTTAFVTDFCLFGGDYIELSTLNSAGSICVGGEYVGEG